MSIWVRSLKFCSPFLKAIRKISRINNLFALVSQEWASLSRRVDEVIDNKVIKDV